MASKKLGSEKFVAVYRLEFYKNKKKWMLHDQKAAECNAKNRLNVTFNVEDGENLNDAFIETASDSDKASKTDVCRAPNLSRQWLENVNIWPTDRPDTLESLLIGQRARDDGQVCDRRGQSDPKSPFTLPEIKPSLMQDMFPENQFEMHYCGYERGDHLEFCGNTDTLDGIYPEMDWPNDVPDADSIDAYELPIWTLNNQPVEEQLSASVDSYSAFCRGADLNPHCSEIELKLNDSMKELDANVVARMSSTELRSSIQAHARALAALLRENNERLKLRHSASNVSSEDADVTRDHADFVAGSFRNRDYCVHIEYGRPVRFKDI